MKTAIQAQRVVIALAALSILLACSSERDDREGASIVRMYDNAFSPLVVHVPEGGRVRWRNVGRNPHNAIGDDGAWSTKNEKSEPILLTEEAAVVDFAEAGVYPYFCSFHGAPGGIGMAGTVVVGDAEFIPGGGEKVSVVAESSGVIRHVPVDYPNIQAGVDAAGPGDLILIEPGVYREEVMVTTPSLVLRGTDRNEVVIDGEWLRGNGIVILADGVAVENLTVRNALLNGVFWSGVTGYRASYVTAYNNMDYGVYAFDSVDGLFEHSYASGSPDAGFYIGQCQPCRAVIRNVIAENNALGYSGTNAGGELYITSSIWRRNMAGIVPNTLDSELLPPVRNASVIANLVVDNNNRTAPTKPLEIVAFGNGIVVAGGQGNLVERNVVVGHEQHGILLAPALDENFWMNTKNIVRDNLVLGSNRAGIGLVGPGSGGNCFEGNEGSGTVPPGLHLLQPCSGLRAPFGYDLASGIALLHRMRSAKSGSYPHGSVQQQPVPGPQLSMPGGAAAPVRPAVDVFEKLAFDPKKAEPPSEAADYIGKTASQWGLADPNCCAGPTMLRVAFDVWGSVIPFVLFVVAWLVAALDLLRRKKLDGSARLGWWAVVTLLPWLGSGLYLIAGQPKVGSGLRLLILAILPLLYLVTLVYGTLATGAL